MQTEKMKDMHIVCREGDTGEKWLIDGKTVPIDRKPIDWAKVVKPMYTAERSKWTKK